MNVICPVGQMSCSWASLLLVLAVGCSRKSEDTGGDHLGEDGSALSEFEDALGLWKSAEVETEGAYVEDWTLEITEQSMEFMDPTDCESWYASRYEWRAAEGPVVELRELGYYEGDGCPYYESESEYWFSYPIGVDGDSLMFYGEGASWWQRTSAGYGLVGQWAVYEWSHDLDAMVPFSFELTFFDGGQVILVDEGEDEVRVGEGESSKTASCSYTLTLDGVWSYDESTYWLTIEYGSGVYEQVCPDHPGADFSEELSEDDVPYYVDGEPHSGQGMVTGDTFVRGARWTRVTE